MSAPMRGCVEEGDSLPPISVRPKLKVSASMGRGRGRGRIEEQGQVGASCGRGFRNARGVIQCHGCGFQANSTREFSEHATQSQGSIGDVGGLKGECPGKVQTGYGGGDSKVEKQTVVDHMTKKFAGDPNDLRSRIVQLSGTAAEKGAVHPTLCKAGRVEDRQAPPNVWPRSDGVPNLSGGIPRVNLPTGKPVPPTTCTSSISQQTEVLHQPRQPSNFAFEQHCPIDAHQQQELSPFERLPQPASQLAPRPRVPNVSSRCILLLEREVHLQEDLAAVIGQKSLIKDTDSRECYIAVLKREIAIRKQLEQVTKELELEQALTKNQDDLSTIFVPSVQPAASSHLHPGSSYGESGSGDLRREEDLGQAALMSEQQRRSLLCKSEAGSGNTGQENFSRSTTPDLFYDSDSEEEELQANSGQRIQNMESEEDRMNNFEVERQQMLILEKIKEDKENEKKSLALIAKLSLEETSGETRSASACVMGEQVTTMRFLPSQFPSLEVKSSKAELSTAERIAALKAAAVAQGTYVDSNSRTYVDTNSHKSVTGGCLSHVEFKEGTDCQVRKEEKLMGQAAEAKRLRDVKMPTKNEKPVKLGDWTASNAPRRRSVEITNVAFKKKNLEKGRKKEEEKGMRSRRNSETMAEMDAERKLHANIIKERAAVQAREKLASQREVVVAKEWEEASRRKELAEKARFAGTVAAAAAGETLGSKRSSRDKSKDKPTKEQRSNRWSSVGHGAKAKPSNPRSRKTSGK